MSMAVLAGNVIVLTPGRTPKKAYRVIGFSRPL